MRQGLTDRKSRVHWADLAKGLTILLVVILHSTGGVELHLGQEGWMHPVIAFAGTFRMPVFFAVSGLFAARAISKDWATFLDSKFAHFLYFYYLWMTIQFIFKTPFFIQSFGVDGTVGYYLLSFVQPFGLLWFIFLLPIYFLTLRLTRGVPMLAQIALAIACRIWFTETGINVVDFFSKYYIFFLVGHFGRDLWFLLAEWAKAHRGATIAALLVWAGVNGAVVATGHDHEIPAALALGALGFVAVVSFMAILPERGLAQLLRYIGRHSLPIYLGFFLPMGVTRILIPRLFESWSIGTISFVVSISSIVGALIMYELVKRSGIGSFLYTRPQWARIGGFRAAPVTAAE